MVQIQTNGLAAMHRLDAQLTSIEGTLAKLEAAQKQSLQTSEGSIQKALHDSRVSLQVIGQNHKQSADLASVSFDVLLLASDCLTTG